MFIRTDSLPDVPTAHGTNVPVFKKVILSKGVIPRIMQIATAVTSGPCNLEHTAHLHETMWECYFITEGRGIFTVGDETRDVQAGDFIAVPPQTNHFYNVAEDIKFKFFYFCLAIDDID